MSKKYSDLTDAQKEKLNAYKREWYVKNKAKKEAELAAAVTTDSVESDKDAVIEALQQKLVQYEGLIKSYIEQARAAETKLQNATLEYNARLAYVHDCVKHCYMSINFAKNAMKGGNNND